MSAPTSPTRATGTAHAPEAPTIAMKAGRRGGGVIHALDLSLTRIGAASWDGAEATTEAIVVKGSGVVRLAGYRQRIAALGMPALVVKEAPVYGGMKSSATATIHTVADMLYHDFGVPVVEIHPAHLKGYVMGKCVGDKTAIGVEVFSRFGRRFDTDDECDAFVLLAMALDHYGTPLATMPAKNRAWLAKVDWPEVMPTA